MTVSDVVDVLEQLEEDKIFVKFVGRPSRAALRIKSSRLPLPVRSRA